jgi:hypothetical protein
MATIATVGPTSFDVFLAPETQAAVATIACLHADCRFIDEFHCFSLKKTPHTAGLLDS